jgi:hypothetical protein
MCMSDHHNMCHMTSSISTSNDWSRLIACILKANIHSGVISNTCAHEKPLEGCRKFKWVNVHGSQIQDVVNRIKARQFNVHPSTFSRQVSTRQRHRYQLKTRVRQGLFIVTTSRRNSFMSATKFASELLWASGVRISDQTESVRNRLLRDVYLRARRTLLWYIWLKTTSSSNACCLGNQLSALVSLQMSFVFIGIFADGCARFLRGRIERFHPENIIQSDRYGGSVMIWG